MRLVRLLAAVLAGVKTATCWAGVLGSQGSRPGLRIIAQDGAGRDRALIEIIEVFENRFNLVEADFARAEGEGDFSLAYWREVHEGFFSRQGVFAPDMPIWCARFRLIEALGGDDQ